MIYGSSGFWKFPYCSNYALGLKVHTYFAFGGKSGVIQELKTKSVGNPEDFKNKERRMGNLEQFKKVKRKKGRKQR